MYPMEPEGVELHHRSYEIRAYRIKPGELLLRGKVTDQKPPGVYFENDLEPLEIHHMIIDVSVSFPDLIITDVIVVMETHPHKGCIKIVDHYKKLVGLSIARGFTKKVRELFGGPRGCSHTTALLNAMAPVAIQSVWSMRSVSATEQRVDPPISDRESIEQIKTRMAFNSNTCHIWADPGPMYDQIEAGLELPPPIWAEERAQKLGQSISSWRERISGASTSSHPSNAESR